MDAEHAKIELEILRSHCACNRDVLIHTHGLNNEARRLSRERPLSEVPLVLLEVLLEVRFCLLEFWLPEELLVLPTSKRFFRPSKSFGFVPLRVFLRPSKRILVPSEGGIGERAQGPQNNIHSWANDIYMLVAVLAKTKTNSLREAPVSLRGRGPGSPPVVALSVPPWRSSACISPPRRPPLPPPCLSPHRGEGQGGGRGGLYKKGYSEIRKSGRRAVQFSPRTGWRGLVFGGENVTDPYLSRPRLPPPHNTPAWGP